MSDENNKLTLVKTYDGSVYYKAKFIICQDCGHSLYLSGLVIQYYTEHGLPVPLYCPECAMAKYRREHGYE